MTDTNKTPDQQFDEAIASPESKLALAEMVEDAKKDKVVESFKVSVPVDLFDNLEEE